MTHITGACGCGYHPNFTGRFCYNWEQVYNTNDVNEALTCFNRTVKAIFDRHAPQIVKKVNLALG